MLNVPPTERRRDFLCFQHRIKLYTIILLVKDIQRVYRGHLARREAAARLDSVCRLQAWQRMLVLRRRYKKLRRAAEIVQVQQPL